MKIRWPQFMKKLEILIIIKDKCRQLNHKRFTTRKYVTKRFRKRLGRELNLVDPIKYNDKIQWLKLNWYDTLAEKCADKYEVRNFISETIGEKYLNNLLGVYESVDEINLDQLPKSFVLKGTHGSGYNIICKDKDTMDWNRAFKTMRRWSRNNYYWETREWVYKDIKPRIICEEYMEEKDSGELRDYKFFCFNGQPKMIQVDVGRFTEHKKNIYDLDWNLMGLEIEVPSDSSLDIERPDTLEEMIKLSRILSQSFPHVRVDFYNLNNKVVFGELTFFNGDGLYRFNPPEYERTVGQWLELPD